MAPTGLAAAMNRRPSGWPTNHRDDGSGPGMRFVHELRIVHLEMLDGGRTGSGADVASAA